MPAWHLEFASPAALLLLLVLPAWWWWRRRHERAGIVFSRTALLAVVAGGRRRWTRILAGLRNLLLLLAVVALARPRAGARAENVTSEGINIVIAIDLSSSMLSEDFQPDNRLEVAKRTVKQFIAERTSDRIGIVAFAAEALTQVPLTTDYAVVDAAVDNLQAGQLEDGTAIGTAIATAANRLREAPGRSRVMILLTDGVNNRGAIDPRTAARAAADFGIKIYTIGVGTEGMAPVPVGRGLFGLRYENRPVEIDEALLTDVARVTGGKYFRARDAAALTRIYQQIDRLERVPVQTKTYVQFTELYRWPLALAMASLLLELGLAAWKAPLP
ncbi:MAG: VWA domain-containing protein [Gemmatimonadota bacterium]|nr:VWA domain-containing protein [Gemmatimonadota bacterium]MDE3172143.1 VWA domain-containing protein [Gemmatimonadota bacterium]MDE3216578.1 VWA domain-containing protein [Gemmatimonadota bacterium]